MEWERIANPRYRVHLLGLDDQDGDENGVNDPYYGGENGIMEYKGTNLSPISDNDVKSILSYAKDYLSTRATGADVKILSQEGNSNGANPLGVINDTNSLDESKLPKN